MNEPDRIYVGEEGELVEVWTSGRPIEVMPPDTVIASGMDFRLAGIVTGETGPDGDLIMGALITMESTDGNATYLIPASAVKWLHSTLVLAMDKFGDKF